jgi:hypothetical protein
LFACVGPTSPAAASPPPSRSWMWGVLGLRGLAVKEKGRVVKVKKF